MSSTILLADDSLTIQKVVELTFADTDYEVVAVSGGEELLGKIPEVEPDVIICDVIMPGMDGYDVCQDVKSNPDTLHIPVILLTGTFEPFDRDRALAVGCSDIITKPFEARKLVESVERLLKGEAAPPEVAAQAPPPVAEPVPGAVAPPPAEDFGTRLAAEAPTAEEEAPAAAAETIRAEAPIEPEPVAPAAEAPEVPAAPGAADELDFTTSGFAEMEAAGERQAGFVPPPPAEGLDFEIGGAPPEAAGPAPEPAPAEPEAPLPEPEAEPVEPAPAEPEPAPAAPFEPPGGAAPFEPPTEPPAAEHVVEEPAKTDPAMTVPIESYMPPPEEEAAPEAAPPEAPSLAETLPEAPPVVPPEVAEEQPEVLPVEAPPAAEAPPPAEVAEEEAPVEVAPAVAAPPAFPPAEAVEAQPEASYADTAPVEPPAQPAVAALSDADVDRIARRLLELATERIDRIAWEAIPDVAEIVVRERIRELEAEIDRGGAESES